MLLNANGFPLGLINRQIKLFLHKQETSETKSTHFGPEKRVIFCLYPFVVKIVSNSVGKLVGLLTKLHLGLL